MSAQIPGSGAGEATSVRARSALPQRVAAVPPRKKIGGRKNMRAFKGH